MVEMRNMYKILVGKSEGKTPYARPEGVWKDSIKMLKKLECEGVDWINLAQIRFQWQLLSTR
jgi:hypothetical protein